MYPHGPHSDPADIQDGQYPDWTFTVEIVPYARACVSPFVFRNTGPPLSPLAMSQVPSKELIRLPCTVVVCPVGFGTVHVRPVPSCPLQRT